VAKRKKSQRRSLAELVARQRNIKVTSAFGYIRRAEKANFPNYSGLSDYARKKLKATVKASHRARHKIPEPFETVKGGRFKKYYESYDHRTVAVKGEYNFYGTDKRRRTIRLEMDGDELNRFLNAASKARAADVLTSLSDPSMGFLHDADIDIENFTLDGKYHNADEFGN
jgi:hypothetical protein